MGIFKFSGKFVRSAAFIIIVLSSAVYQGCGTNGEPAKTDSATATVAADTTAKAENGSSVARNSEKLRIVYFSTAT
ncbi:MAG: hypothetical protein CVV64_11145 [Candidatus Wallbacteria bacterium HGW-Wallbacteria-1]|jgi:hypothetical protein|uniref:Uncharacterized protein n=1 Tax=Candidatus Wallbacteria bacterium HGW-Wallbacteria-1 TaxID=2013854 RepID=A0A2N1PNZ3_9BACT|nr:MAG: hypothetical protein CVV64_11145 [Candidatus Wallbacteria bacterium HGW-Wallbacteria-1]